MKKITRIMSAVLSLVMLLTMTPISVWADTDTFEYLSESTTEADFLAIDTSGTATTGYFRTQKVGTNANASAAMTDGVLTIANSKTNAGYNFVIDATTFKGAARKSGVLSYEMKYNSAGAYQIRTGITGGTDAKVLLHNTLFIFNGNNNSRGDTADGWSWAKIDYDFTAKKVYGTVKVEGVDTVYSRDMTDGELACTDVATPFKLTIQSGSSGTDRTCSFKDVKVSYTESVSDTTTEADFLATNTSGTATTGYFRTQKVGTNANASAAMTDGVLKIADSKATAGYKLVIDATTFKGAARKSGILTYEFKYKVDANGLELKYGTSASAGPGVVLYNIGVNFDGGNKTYTADSDGYRSVKLEYNFVDGKIYLTTNQVYSRAMTDAEKNYTSTATPFMMIVQSSSNTKDITGYLKDVKVSYSESTRVDIGNLKYGYSTTDGAVEKKLAQDIKKIGYILVPFNMEMKESSVVADRNITLATAEGSDVEVAVTYNSATKTATVTPTVGALAPNTEYKLTVLGMVESEAGIRMVGDHTRSFITDDAARPKIKEVKYFDGEGEFDNAADSLSVREIRVKFDAEMESNTINNTNITLKKSATKENPAYDIAEDISISYNKGTCVATITPASGASFDKGTAYKLEVKEDAADVYGLKVEGFDKEFVTPDFGINVSECAIKSRLLTIKGRLQKDGLPITGKNVTIAVYDTAVNGAGNRFGSGTKFIGVAKTDENGFFEVIDQKIHDDEISAVRTDLTVDFDAPEIPEPDSITVQYVNYKQIDVCIAALKASPKGVFEYITSEDSSLGLSAVQNKRIYEDLNIDIDDYNSFSSADKAKVDASLEAHRAELSRENIINILNGSIAAIKVLGMNSADAAELMEGYDKEIGALEVYESQSETVSYSNIGDSTYKEAIAVNTIQNIKTDYQDGYTDYLGFEEEVKKSMVIELVTKLSYTDLKALILSNKALLSKKSANADILTALQNETNVDIVNAAMKNISIKHSQTPYTHIDTLLADISKEVKVQQDAAAKKEEEKNNSDTTTNNFAVGDGGSGGGGGGLSSKDNEESDVSNDEVIKTEENPETSTIEIFKDMNGFEWAKTAVENLYGKGIVQGTGADKYEPGRAVTREEFVKLVCEAFGFEIITGDTGFVDVVSDEWYEKYINTAVSLGIVTGKSETEFGVGESITREDMAVMIIRALKAYGKLPENAERKSFDDKNDISDYALESVEQLCGMGIINGIGDNKFAPKNNANRAEAAVIINRCL